MYHCLDTFPKLEQLQKRKKRISKKFTLNPTLVQVQETEKTSKDVKLIPSSGSSQEFPKGIQPNDRMKDRI